MFYAVVCNWLCFMLQYYTDANEAESWIKEKLPLAQSEDYGKDEETAKVRIL